MNSIGVRAGEEAGAVMHRRKTGENAVTTFACEIMLKVVDP